MNLIYAALLLHSAKKEISEANVKKIVQASGESVEDSQVKALISALEGVNIGEAITKAAMPVAVAAAPVAASVEAHADKKEEKAEDTEKKAEEAAAGLSSLFG